MSKKFDLINTALKIMAVGIVDIIIVANLILDILMTKTQTEVTH